MTLSRVLAATCCILALAGCGSTESSPPAGATPPAGTTVSGTKPAAAPAASAAPASVADATPRATDEALTSPTATKSADVEYADPGPVATSELLTITQGSRALLVTANARLTDQEVKALLESIEKKRSAFEAALDDKLKNSTIKGIRGEVNVNEFFDDLQDQVERTRERFSSNYPASSEVVPLLQFATRLDTWASTQPAGFRGSKEWGALATDFRRLSAAYNSPLLRPGQQALGIDARRLNDAELVAAAANVDKSMDAFRNAYDSALNGVANLAPASRQTAIQ